jgi:hypothetical protein
MGLSTIILGKTVSQVRRKNERKFEWDSKGVFTDSFIHGKEETTTEESIGAWRKQWWTFLQLLGVVEG